MSVYFQRLQSNSMLWSLWDRNTVYVNKLLGWKKFSWVDSWVNTISKWDTWTWTIWDFLILISNSIILIRFNQASFGCFENIVFLATSKIFVYPLIQLTKQDDVYCCILRAYGIPSNLFKAIETMHTNEKAKIVTPSGETDLFNLWLTGK